MLSVHETEVIPHRKSHCAVRYQQNVRLRALSASFQTVSLETVWKVLSGCSAGLRSALWRAKDTVQICPTMNGVASVRICLVPQGKDALGFTAYGRSLTPSSTS